MELEKVSRLLGHANLGQTLAYAEIIREALHRSARKHEDTLIRAPGARTNGRPRELVRCPGPASSIRSAARSSLVSIS